MIDRPETAVQIGMHRAEALRASADRVRMLRELPEEMRVPVWRIRIAAWLRGVADRVAPAPIYRPHAGPGGSGSLSAGGPPPC